MTGRPFYVFSYGSNLLYERIKARIGSVEVVGTYNLPGFRLVFNKKSEDGSAKANIEETGNPDNSVWGVLHKMDIREKIILDWHETLGYGYQLVCFRVSINGSIETVHTYLVNEPRYEIKGRPYCWYLKYVIAGAKLNGFPADYIEKLKTVKSDPDPDQRRREINENIIRHSNEKNPDMLDDVI